ncbi:unnamed protein product [Allacma fusca]|uniref:Uncharacterized protein n=1 Tax=Allacma fusca TaxID=39272 RepID=A0A8J2LT49_9HEXA|nr:unnamed protein product [Allacma fusca]
MGDKREHYQNQMAVWNSRFNAPAAQEQQLAVTQQRIKNSQSDNNLPELVTKDIGQSVNLRSHSDIRYHMNTFENTYYLDKQRTEQYRRDLDDQIRERDRRRMLERQLNNGVELAPLIMKRKSPSLPKLPYLNSTDVTRPFNFSPRIAAWTPQSPETYHQELSMQQNSRTMREMYQRERDRQEAERHFNNWALLWGRPGHGAPQRVHHKKENLFKLLHYNINRK